MIIADTGFPGSPNTSVPSGAWPNHVGLPGFSRTPQNRSSTPRAASAGFTWSCGPTDTPPEPITTSASSIARANASSVAERSSRTIALLVTRPPGYALVLEPVSDSKSLSRLVFSCGVSRPLQFCRVPRSRNG